MDSLFSINSGGCYTGGCTCYDEADHQSTTRLTRACTGSSDLGRSVDFSKALVHPHMVDADLEAAYVDMAADEARESEALA